MNGVSPYNYRSLTPEKERRMIILTYSFFLGFGLVGAVTYPIWSAIQGSPMTPDGWLIVLLLAAMAIVGGNELVKEIRKTLTPLVNSAPGCLTLSFQSPTVIGNILEIEIKPTLGAAPPNIMFVTDNVGNAYTEVQPFLWRAVNQKVAVVVVTLSYTGGSTFDFQLREWGADGKA